MRSFFKDFSEPSIFFQIKFYIENDDSKIDHMKLEAQQYNGGKAENDNPLPAVLNKIINC